MVDVLFEIDCNGYISIKEQSDRMYNVALDEGDYYVVSAYSPALSRNGLFLKGEIKSLDFKAITNVHNEDRVKAKAFLIAIHMLIKNKYIVKFYINGKIYNIDERAFDLIIRQRIRYRDEFAPFLDYILTKEEKTEKKICKL